MQERKYTKAIALGGIFAAIYAIITALSVYVVPILGIIGLMIMPIFAAYYTSVFDLKCSIFFNIATLIVCFFISVTDPFYTLLYVFPTLIIGDVFGLLNHKNILYYSTVFIQAIAYSVTNAIAIYLASLVYDVNIVSALIKDTYIYEHFGLCILFILSGSEAILCSVLVNEQLTKFKIYKYKEKQIPNYMYYFYVIFYMLAIGSYFISLNIFNLLILILIVLAVPIVSVYFKEFKLIQLYTIIYLVLFASLFFLLAYYSLPYVALLYVPIPFLIFSIVKIINNFYNKDRNKKEN